MIALGFAIAFIFWALACWTQPGYDDAWNEISFYCFLVGVGIFVVGVVGAVCQHPALLVWPFV